MHRGNYSQRSPNPRDPGKKGLSKGGHCRKRNKKEPRQNISISPRPAGHLRAPRNWSGAAAPAVAKVGSRTAGDANRSDGTPRRQNPLGFLTPRSFTLAGFHLGLLPSREVNALAQAPILIGLSSASTLRGRLFLDIGTPCGVVGVVRFARGCPWELETGLSHPLCHGAQSAGVASSWFGGLEGPTQSPVSTDRV